MQGVAGEAIGLASLVGWFLPSSTISAPFVGTQVTVSQRVGNDDERVARATAYAELVVAVLLEYGAFGVFWARTASIVAAAVALGPYSLSAANDGMYARAAERLDATDD